MRRVLPILAAILTFVPLYGCVSSGKYNALENELGTTQLTMAEEIAVRDQRIAALDSALGKSRAEVDRLTKREAELQSLLEDTQRELASVMHDRSQFQQSAQELQQALAANAVRRRAAEARLAQFRELLDRFRTLIDAGTLSVKIVDGRMVLELQSDILFASGSARLSASGRETIGEVAGVLATLSDRQFQVEGHTDTVPISSERFPSNWHLGSARALVVVEAMLQNGMKPEHISAASFGENRPAAANDTAEGKAANRRIEIVVVPDLSSLPGFEELNAAVKQE